MSKFTYTTKDGTKTGFVPGVGEIIDGQITSDFPIDSANLLLVDNTEVANEAMVGTASQQNPNQPETADAPINAGVQG